MNPIIVSKGNMLKKVPMGFSWTMLFFGFFVPLIRQDYILGIVLLISGVLTYGIFPAVFAFFYNKMYLNQLLEKGYMIEEDSTTGISDSYLREYLNVKEVPYAIKKVG